MKKPDADEEFCSKEYEDVRAAFFSQVRRQLHHAFLTACFRAIGY
jgi:hypothetical protein